MIRAFHNSFPFFLFLAPFVLVRDGLRLRQQTKQRNETKNEESKMQKNLTMWIRVSDRDFTP